MVVFVGAEVDDDVFFGDFHDFVYFVAVVCHLVIGAEVCGGGMDGDFLDEWVGC